LDSWCGNSESSVAAALEDDYRQGINRAAEYVDSKGEKALAGMLRELAKQDTPKK
jgi:hypothetical protein